MNYYLLSMNLVKIIINRVNNKMRERINKIYYNSPNRKLIEKHFNLKSHSGLTCGVYKNIHTSKLIEIFLFFMWVIIRMIMYIIRTTNTPAYTFYFLVHIELFNNFYVLTVRKMYYKVSVNYLKKNKNLTTPSILLFKNILWETETI